MVHQQSFQTLVERYERANGRVRDLFVFKEKAENDAKDVELARVAQSPPLCPLIVTLSLPPPPPPPLSLSLSPHSTAPHFTITAVSLRTARWGVCRFRSETPSFEEKQGDESTRKKMTKEKKSKKRAAGPLVALRLIFANTSGPVLCCNNNPTTSCRNPTKAVFHTHLHAGRFLEGEEALWRCET
jgi:hypothetical protein